MPAKKKNSLSASAAKSLLAILKTRFEKNMTRHADIKWADVEKRLTANAEALWSLEEMERTGGEPDVIGRDKKTGALIIVDCAPESPSGRRSLCYDPESLESRKENKPKGSAIGMVAEMGISVVTEDEYQHLQTLGHFDQKTSSWLSTPDNIRKLKGAIFGDYRFGRVFIYHNGAESYYAARGFRGRLIV